MNKKLNKLLHCGPINCVDLDHLQDFDKKCNLLLEVKEEDGNTAPLLDTCSGHYEYVKLLLNKISTNNPSGSLFPSFQS
jgi:hypothetical protein